MRVTWLPDVLRAAGLRVAEQAGWRGRGRELTGCNGIIAHHTAGPRVGECPSLNVVTFGRNDLPGPLSQLLLGRSGTFYMIADGKANHAGRGSWPGFGGNTNVLGIEAENAGTGLDVWPNIQIDAYVHGVAAILAHLDLDENRVCSHYEFALPRGRKVDPRGVWPGGDWWNATATVHNANADQFRARVRAVLEGDEALTPEEHALLAKAAEDAAYCRHILDDVVRPKLDAVYIDTHASDHPEVLAGMVRALYDGSKP